jgi:hypothetical protein
VLKKLRINCFFCRIFVVKKIDKGLSSEVFHHAMFFLPLLIQIVVDYVEDVGMLAYDVK